jgi:hypothetical protein
MIIYLLLTTTSLFVSNFLNHLQQSNFTLWDDGIFDEGYQMISYGPVSSENSYGSSFLHIICSGLIHQIHSQHIQELIKDYYRFQEKGRKTSNFNPLDWFVPKPNMSCILTDRERKILWLVGDDAGTSPMWLSTKDRNKQTRKMERDVGPYEREIVVTTDLLGALALGYLDFKTVGAGVTMAINATSLEILTTNHWTQSEQLQQCSESQLDPITLLNLSHSLLTPLIHSSSSTTRRIISELDPLDKSSLLLDFALSTHSDDQTLSSRLKYHPTAPQSWQSSVSNDHLVNPYTSCK